jgi:hypothetical protein
MLSRFVSTRKRPRLRAAAAKALVIALAASALGAAGCGGAAQGGAEDATSSTSSTSAAKAPTPPPKAAPGHLLREDVDQALVRGPAWILRRVVPAAVMQDGAFVGWQLDAMPEEWAGIAIQPGDIVTRVNGVTLERPTDLWKAWVALTVAPELRISYLRGEEAKELVMPIDGAPTLDEAKLQKGAGAGAGAGQGRPAAKRRETIVIQGSSPAESESEPAP